jgi:hypothetical protein
MSENTDRKFDPALPQQEEPAKKSSWFICAEWRIREEGPILNFNTMRRRKLVNRCDLDEGHEGDHVDQVLLVNWSKAEPIPTPLPQQEEPAKPICKCGHTFFMHDGGGLEGCDESDGKDFCGCKAYEPTPAPLLRQDEPLTILGLDEYYLAKAEKFMQDAAKMEGAPIPYMVAAAFKNEDRAKIAEASLTQALTSLSAEENTSKNLRNILHVQFDIRDKLEASLAAAQKELQSLREKESAAWIDTKHELPPEGNFVFVWTHKPIRGGGHVVIRKRNGFGWQPRMGAFTTEAVTHWMPLPVAPTKLEQEK